MIRRLFVTIPIVVGGVLLPSMPEAAGAPPVPASSSPTAPSTSDPSVQRTLRALDKLRSMGYRWTSDAGALKVIKAWQTANGLVVDGIVGTQTERSLGLVDGQTQIVAPTVAPVAAGATPSAPATRVAPPPAGDVESIIRDVWPDDLEDWAVRIATRESRLTPTAANSCCYGLFQIHFRAHRAWLADYGVNSPEDLFDARTNATVALALYQQAGPGPWAL